MKAQEPDIIIYNLITHDVDKVHLPFIPQINTNIITNWALERTIVKVVNVQYIFDVEATSYDPEKFRHTTEKKLKEIRIEVMNVT